MEKQEFKEKLSKVSNDQVMQSDYMMIESGKHMHKLVSEFNDEETAKRLLNIINYNLESIRQCTKALRGTMRDLEYAAVYSEAPESGLRFSIIAIEELSELALALVKKVHPEEKYEYEDGLQEFADVCICMDHIEFALGLDPESRDLDKAIVVKSQRLLDSFNKTKTYK